MGLDQEQLNAVDDALSICNYHDSQYGRIAYSLGFKDAVHLIMELFADWEVVYSIVWKNDTCIAGETYNLRL